jgi:hypothetical protein
MIDASQGKVLTSSEQPTGEQYRYTAQEIWQVAQRTTSPELRAELLQLAKRYERLAARVEARQL